MHKKLTKFEKQKSYLYSSFMLKKSSNKNLEVPYVAKVGFDPDTTKTDDTPDFSVPLQMVSYFCSWPYFYTYKLRK